MNYPTRKNRIVKKSLRKRILSALSCVVVFATTYALILPAITLDRDSATEEPGIVLSQPYYDEADSAASAWVDEPAADGPAAETELAEVTDLSAEQEVPAEQELPAAQEIPAGPEAAAEQELPAETEVSAVDFTADTETQDDWDAMFADFDFTGVWGADLAAVAETQLGYAESGNNYILDASGLKKGYTRYGAWYDAPYGDWSAMFVSFCLEYAGIPAESMLRSFSCPYWMETLRAWDMYRAADGYVPAQGDLVFLRFGDSADDEADHMGIVTGTDELGGLTAVAGDVDGEVRSVYYDLTDGAILGYGVLPENPDAAAEPETFADAAEPGEEPALPAQHFEDDAGDAVHVTVDAPAGAFPADTVMHVETVESGEVLDAAADAVEGEVAAVRAVDITFCDAGGSEIEPLLPVSVTLTAEAAETAAEEPVVVHIADDGEAGVVENAVTEGEDVSFTAETLPVYAIVYTVDFSWEVDGRTYGLSLPGGGYVSFEALMELLGVADNAAGGADAEAEADGSELEYVSAGEETKRFVAGVESVTFSDPDLVWVGKIEADTTVGRLKAENALDIEYSADLTEEQIEDIDAQTASAGDWALISLRPFESEETLTVTMKNGETFVVRVTDAQPIPDAEASTVDENKSYLICYQAGDTYYLLKNDGSVDSSHTPADFENLNSTYCWSFSHIFKEKDVTNNLDKNYYLIRPIDNRTKTISLNNMNEPLVQQSNNNVAVVQVDGGFVLEGYHNIGTEDEPLYIQLGFANGAFVGVDDESGVTIKIYEMDALPTYDYTVRSASETRGSVTVSDGTLQNITNQQGQVVGHYYSATSNSGKTNDGIITAVPTPHQNTTLGQGDTGYGENKWEFDHWELDGVPLDRNQYPATIQANALPIPFNGSNLVAYFKQNPNYVVPPSEKEPTTIDNMTGWLEELENRNIPLEGDATKKTAEVYDYENRIYRVDITSKANFQTFSGSLDMAFCLDVSNSMYFPSKLLEADTNYNNGANPVPIYQINWSNSNKNWLDTSRDWNNPYYLIADPNGTATVFKIYYQNGNWKAQDASRETESDRSFVIGNAFATNWTSSVSDKTHPFNAGDDNNSTYVIYDAGDDGHDRFYYLNQSLGGGSTDLNTITELLRVAGAASPNVNIAYNTFNKNLGSQRQDFQPAATLSIDLSHSHGGGTRPDQAFFDAMDFSWSADYDEDTGETDRYVILVTDGAPQGKRDDDWDTDIEYMVRIAAQALKNDAHVKLITIGLSMDDVTSGKRLLYDLADLDNNGNKMFYMAESASDLLSIFRQVTKALMEDVVVYGDITDTVGDAFYLVDKATGMPLAPGDKIDIEGFLTTDESQAAGVVQDDGKTIKWLDQAIDASTGWHGTVYVKAKEDLLGGNAVKTNDGEATVVATKYQTGGKDPVYFDTTEIHDKLHLTASLPSPKVNVNELTFPKTNTEWTVYLGTEVDPQEQLKALYEGILVEQVINDDDSLHFLLAPNNISDDRDDDPSQMTGTAATFPLAPVILEHMVSEGGEDCAKYYTLDENNNATLNWDVFLADIVNGGVKVPYHPYGIEGEDSNLEIKLVKNVSFDGSDPIPAHNTDTVGEGVETYTLTVRFNPDYVHVLPVGQGGTHDVDMHAGVYGSMYQGHASGRETSTNTLVINVYKVPLDVYKTDQNDNPLPGAVFELYEKVEAAGAGEGGAGGTATGVTVPGLSGTYNLVASATSGNDGIARIDPADGLHAGKLYYLIESAAPAGYTRDSTVWTVRLQTEVGKFTDLDGDPIYPSTGQIEDDMYPFNWDEGARILIDGHPASVIAKGATEGTTIEITDGSYVSNKTAISFRHQVENIGGDLTITVNKTWSGEDNPPASIKVKLYRVSEKDHEWGDAVVVPCTCTEDGVKQYTCLQCGATKEEAITAEGHVSGTPHRENETESTCTTHGGYDMVTQCTICGAIISSEHTEYPLLEHVPGEAQEENRIEPTCTEDGSYDSVVRCTLCGAVLSSTHYTIPASHDWVTQEQELPQPDPNDLCYETVNVCSRCGAVDETTRQSHAHDWGEWTETTPAQVGVAGEETRVCNHNSNHVETRATEPLPDPTHTVTIYFRCIGNGNGGTDYNGQITWLADRSGTGAGNMTIQWNWDQWTTPQSFDVDGLGTSSYTTSANSNNQGAQQTLTISNITSDLTVYVTIRNGGWTGTNNGLIGQPTFSGPSRSAAFSAQSRRSSLAAAGATDTADRSVRGLTGTEPLRGGEGDPDPGTGSTRNAMTAAELTAYLESVKPKADATCADGGDHIYVEEVPHDGDDNNEYTVSAADGWTLDIGGLPQYNEYGKPYTYYVVETVPSTGYDVTYTGQNNGLQGSNTAATITNTKVENTTELTFSKIWRDTASSVISWPAGKSITVQILRALSDTEPDPPVYAAYTITSEALQAGDPIPANGENAASLPTLEVSSVSGGTYTFHLGDLPLTPDAPATGTYIYYVSEPGAAEGYQTAKYFNGSTQVQGASRIGDNGTIVNDMIGAVLPNTGGPGTHAFLPIGAAMALSALSALGIQRRRRKRYAGRGDGTANETSPPPRGGDPPS